VDRAVSDCINTTAAESTRKEGVGVVPHPVREAIHRPRAGWRRRPPEPKIRLRIADCSNEISLWFELNSDAARENSLYKIDTLLGALTRFRAALDAEAELCAHRAQHRR